MIGQPVSDDHAGDEAERTLVQDGWTVRSGLMWVAEARRGGEYEQATGRTKQEALVHLHELVKADQVLSAP